MPTPLVSTAFGDLLDRRITKVFVDKYNQLPDMIGQLYAQPSVRKGSDERFSEVGELTDFNEFSGSVDYEGVSQGYDVTATHKEFAKGMQIERKLVDDDLYSIIDNRAKALATSAGRTRQKHAARLLNLAFSVDTFFYSHSEGVALCSNSHTTNTNASTSSGFDNLATSALSSTALAAARIQMRGFRDDNANRINTMPNEIWIPPDLYETAHEIVASLGKVDTADNNSNVHFGQYTIIEWNYMTDTNNWFLCDSEARGQWVMWLDRIPLEFARAEDFDTYTMKHRAYMRYSSAYLDWRWCLGSQVS